MSSNVIRRQKKIWNGKYDGRWTSTSLRERIYIERIDRIILEMSDWSIYKIRECTSYK